MSFQKLIKFSKIENAVAKDRNPTSNEAQKSLFDSINAFFMKNLSIWTQ